MGEGSSFQPHALYQQDTAYFNNDIPEAVGQTYWPNTHAAHYWSLCLVWAQIIFKSKKKKSIYCHTRWEAEVSVFMNVLNKKETSQHS